MSYWQGVVLGAVQGLTEFLPISSSGHLVVTEAAVGLRTPGVTVEVALHVATVLAVLVVYRARLGALIRGVVTGSGEARRFVLLLVIGSIPAGVIGLAFADFFERTFDSLLVVGVDFLVTGVVLWSTRRVRERAGAAQPSALGAVGIGIAQAAAILPGISRSGTTISAALWLGVEPVRAAEFSFLLAIPAVAGAGLLQILRGGPEAFTVGGGPLLVSFVAALVTGVLAIRILVTILAHSAFHRFAPYCWTVGAATVAWALLR